MNALVKSDKQAVALYGPVTGSFASIPRGDPVRAAILDLHLAFRAGVTTLSKEEIERRLELYAKAINGFPIMIALAALESLVFDNPEGTMSPSPMLVRKRCEAFRSAWARALWDYAVTGKTWSPPEWICGCPAPGLKGHPMTVAQSREFIKSHPMWRILVRDYAERKEGIERDFNGVRWDIVGDDERLRVENLRANEDERKERARAEWRKNWEAARVASAPAGNALN